ncbi:Triple gene block protein 2 [Nerine virus X]|uniref:Triple gene block protein 2 n=1 Tax=Nerine virus X TaxID=333348 RepID=Q2V0R8_9VIRU|nr:Triple gene block protein 2 [Nerine virus X]AEM23892.1 triple gene block protein 2 [Nerine virus X]BAE66617.1 Triple gene block protein 2 [Nerine virus X]
MPLTAPPDYTHILPIAIVSIAVALSLYTITRNTLPHTGDNIHHFPHGGRYRDGTKSITYCPPQRNLSPFNSTGYSIIPTALAILLPAAIYLSSKCFNSRTHPHSCSHCQPNSATMRGTS